MHEIAQAPVCPCIDLLEDCFGEPPLSIRRGALVQAVNALAAFARGRDSQ